MCGIYGWFDRSLSFEKKYDESQRTPRARLQHRGPEGFGALESANFYGEHHRLKIVGSDLDGKQPFYRADKNSGLLFNGEVYNFMELKKELRAIYPFRTEGDVEVLFAGLEEEGEKFLSRVRGIFAGFYWSQDRNQAFLFRDPFGVKPLYYRKQGERTFFSSEIKPLLKEQTARIHHQALYEHLRLRYSLGSHTIFEGIRKLLPGEILDLQRGEARTIGLSLPLQETSFGEIFREAVRLEIPDFPFYSLLSGGVDSSAVATVLESQTDRVRFMTVRGEGYEEREAYSALQDPSLLDTCEVGEFREVDLQDLVEILEEPIGDSIGLVQERLFRKISQKTKVAFSGEGADELFFGYAHHWILSVLENGRGFSWAKLPFFLNLLFPLIQKALPYEMRLSRQRLHEAFRPWLKGGDFSDKAAHLMSLFSEEEACGLLGNSFSHQSVEEKMKEVSSLEKLRQFELKNWLPFYNLARLDRLSMNHSLELRVPYLDQVFAGRALQFSSKDNLSLRRQKRVLRRFLNGILPAPLRERRKKAFTVNAFNSERLGLRKTCLEVLESRGESLFKPEALKKVLAGTDHYFYDKRLFNLTCLILWRERFIPSAD